jgi:hypothetical protein
VAKKAVPEKEPGQQVAVQHSPAAPAALDQQILMAASDPRVDVAKMRELTELRRQLRMEEAEDIFKHALAEAQREGADQAGRRGRRRQGQVLRADEGVERDRLTSRPPAIRSGRSSS